MIETGK